MTSADDVVWVDLDPTQGRGQRGGRPALVVSSDDYLDSVRDLVAVVPVTSVDCGWPSHVVMTGATGLSRASFAMTEQPRTISTTRVGRRLGAADTTPRAAFTGWLRDFLDLG